MRFGIAILLAVIVQCVLGVNIYQRCGELGEQAFVADPFAKEWDDTPYSYRYDWNLTIHFNFCAGTSKCKGGIACVEGMDGEIEVLAYPGDNAQIDLYGYGQGYDNQLVISYDGEHYVSFLIYCTSIQHRHLELLSVMVTNDWAGVYLYFASPLVCDPLYVAPSSPTSHAYMSGQIYMWGVMPMWSLAAGSGQEAWFEGDFYYSASDLSIKLNGTLTNSKWQKTQVGMIVRGRSDGNLPEISVATFQPAVWNHSCVVLPQVRDQGSLRWFQSANDADHIVRPYESVHWRQGSSFDVQEYFNGPYFSVMQRVSDAATVSLGEFYLTPFADPEYNTFASEVKWDSLSYDVLPSSLFDIPAHCK